MAAQGLDKASPPSGALAKQMLEAIHGRWWCIYYAGHYRTDKSWSPAHVRDYVRHGIDRFMLTYVGQQWGNRMAGTLTRAQGQQDGRDALAAARAFGWSGHVPLCLDVEGSTWARRRAGTIEYAHAWCETVRAGGARPGLYANPDPLVGMLQGGVHADFVWIAKWVTLHAGPRDPHAIDGFPANLWSRPGQRAWQYGGAQGRTPCTVLGHAVDISVADLECLAPPPGGVRAGAASVRRRQALRRGAHGAGVVRLTHRLSIVRSPSTGRPYLDGPRKRFDARAQAALSAFQHDHGLHANGVYDASSARALLTVAKRQKGRATHPHPHQRLPTHAGAAAGRAAARRAGAPTLPQLVEQFERLDAEAHLAWQRIEAYGKRSQRLLARADAERRAGLPGIAASLRGIERRLGELVDAEQHELLVEQQELLIEQQELAVEQRELEIMQGEQLGAPAPASVGTAPAVGTPVPTATSAAQPVEPPPAPHVGDGAGPPPLPAVAPERSLVELTTVELDARIDSLEDGLELARRERIARYARQQKRLRREAEGTSVAPLLERKAAPAAPHPEAGPVTPHAAAGRQAVRRPRHGRTRRHAPAEHEDASSLQQSLNGFTQKLLRGVPPLRVDGVKGAETKKRIQTAKFYLGYGHDERTTAVTPDFVRRLRHPRSTRYADARTLARAARRRRRQRRAALRLAHAPIEGTPKHVIDTIVLPIAAACGIVRTPAEIVAANAAHSLLTDSGKRSDHKGPPDHAWAADMSNGTSPTPQMDELARRLAARFGIPWNGSGLRTTSGHGYRFQLIYREAGHYNHVHFGLKAE
jgi:hypothetical protein